MLVELVLIALVLLAPVLPGTGADCTVTDPTDATSTGADKKIKSAHSTDTGRNGANSTSADRC